MAEPFIGEIKIWGLNYAPQNWAFCTGQIMPISENQALFALLNNIYGGDGRTTYGLPNLTSRIPMGFNMGNPQGLQAFPIGYMGGSQIQSLHTNELPPHNHTATYTPAGSGGSTQLEATTDQGNISTPATGAYLSQTEPTGGPQDKPENIYKSNPSTGSLVKLGGMSGGGSSGGELQVGDTGGGQSFDIMNPVSALNFTIAMLGIFPSRN